MEEAPRSGVWTEQSSESLSCRDKTDTFSVGLTDVLVLGLGSDCTTPKGEFSLSETILS